MSIGFPPISSSSVHPNAASLRTQEQKNADLFKAIGRKDFEEVKALLQEGADINAEGSSGNTPLHVALIFNNYETAKFLLDNGADPEIKCQNLSPLGRALSSSQKNLVMLLIQYVKYSTNWKHCHSLYYFVMDAIDSNDFETAKTIINWGVDINLIGNDKKESFLHKAVEKMALEFTHFLIQNGANLEAKLGLISYNLPMRGTTPLHLAVINEDVQITKLLVDSKADLNAKSLQNRTPLRFAIEKNKNTEIAKLLILAGADLNDRSVEDKPLLNLALEEDNNEISRLLIENGADLNVRDKSGDTPLHIAASYTKKIELAKLLIEKKANVNAKDIYGYTPLFKLSYLSKGGYDLLQLMLKNGANLNVHCKKYTTLLHGGKNSKDEQLLSFLIDSLHQYIDVIGNGDTALQLAIANKNTVYTKLLIDKGADVNLKLYKENHTPLRAAIKNNLGIEIIMSLILAGADLNEKNDDPPLLHFVLNAGMDEMAKLLIEHGADINLQNNKGETPLFEVVRWTKDDNYDFLQFMIAHEARLDVHDKQGNSLLHAARSSFDNRVLTFLVESLHQYIDTQNLGHARTPLHCAVLNNDIDYIRLLLDKGADPNVGDKGGNTALYTAILQSYNDTSYHEIITLLINDKKQDLHCMTAAHDTFLDAAIEQRKHYLSTNNKQLKEGLNDNILLIKKLLENGVKIHRVNTLYNLINGGDIEFLKFIVDVEKSPFPTLSPKGVRALNLLLLRATELRDSKIRSSIAHSISNAFQNKRGDRTIEFVIEAMEKEEQRILSTRLVKRNYKKFNLLNSEISSLKKQIKSSNDEEKKRLESILNAKKEKLQLFNAPIDKAIKLHQKKDFESAKTLLRVNEKVRGGTLLCVHLIGEMAKGNSREKISLLIDRFVNSANLKDMLKLNQVFSIVYELYGMSGIGDLKKVELLEKATRNGFKDIRELLIVQLFVRLKITNVLTEHLQTEENSLDYLEKEVEKLFETNFDLTDVEDFDIKYEKTFSRFRSPIGIFIYAAALSKHNQKDAVKKLLSLYVKDVLEGRFLEERYNIAHSVHLKTISEIDGGHELLETWKRGKALPLEELCKTNAGPSKHHYLEIFKQKIMTDQHLGEDWKEKYPYLLRALENNENLENVIDELDTEISVKKEKINAEGCSDEAFQEILLFRIQEKILMLCQSKEDIDNKVLKSLIDFFAGSEFENDLKSLLKTSKTAPEKISAHTVCDTDDPCDILSMGQEIDASCQRLDGSADLNCGLLGPLLDGKYRIIAVKNAEGKLVARCLLKVLWDKKLKRPVLFQERLYVNGHRSHHKEALKKMCLEKAQEMNLPLLNSEYSYDSKKYPNAVSSIGGRSRFEYVDALRGVKTQVYDISGCTIIWEPTASL